MRFILIFLPILVFSQKIQWVNIEEADKLQSQTNKKLFVDVYTTWCGPCKMLDQYTFSDPKVAEYLSNNFITVKLDAESSATYIFKGKKYNFKTVGRSGVNELADYLLSGNLRYPSMVIVNPDGTVAATILGFLKPDEFLAEITQKNK